MAVWLFCICHQEDLSWSYSLSLCSLLMWPQACRMMICVCKSFNLICLKDILVSHCSQLLAWQCAFAFAPLDCQRASICYSALLSFIGGSLCNVNDKKTFLNPVTYIFFLCCFDSCWLPSAEIGHQAAWWEFILWKSIITLFYFFQVNYSIDALLWFIKIWEIYICK